jgi:GLPGLI family protein
MKKQIITTLLLVVCTSLLAQNKAVSINYNKVVNMHKLINNPSMAQYMPEFKTSKFNLLCNNNCSFFKELAEDDEMPDALENKGGGALVTMKMGGGADELFVDFEHNVLVSKKEKFEKKFIVTDTIKKFNWKLSNETKTILGYACRKATTKSKKPKMKTITITSNGESDSSTIKKSDDDTKVAEIEVVAWYCEALPSNIGPDVFCGLPGAILELTIDNGITKFEATEIVKTTKPSVLKKPTGGKEITAAQYEIEMAEMFKNMQMGGGGMIKMGQ